MKLDISEVNHNYITRVIIFSVFTFKNLYKSPNVFKQSVLSFCLKRIPWKIKIDIDVGPSIPKSEWRDAIIDNILFESEIGLSMVSVYYETGFKKVNLNINLEEEEKYQIYLYS